LLIKIYSHSLKVKLARCRFGKYKQPGDSQTMDFLRDKLLSLEGIDVRKKVSLITELLPAVTDAQNGGYKLEAIYKEVNNHIKMSSSTFFTTLYRARAAQKRKETETKSPDVPENEDKSSRAEISKNKLAEFKKR